jgi:hypothetical protein
MAARKAEFIFVGDAQSVIRAAKQTSAATEKAGKTVEGVHVRMRRSFAGMSASAAKMGAGVIAAYASIEAVKKAVTTTDELAKSTLTLHKSFGLSIKSASEWSAVAKARGADGKSLVMGFKALATQTRNARQGLDAQGQAVDTLRRKQDLALQQAVKDGKSTADITKLKQQQALAFETLTSKSSGNVKTFNQLAISQVQLRKHGDDLNWVLHAVSDGLGKLPAGTDKAAIQAKLFGRTWTAVSPLIRGGSKAMDEQLAVAEKYGATLNGHSIKSVEGLIKAQREAKLASMGLQVTLGTTLIPTLAKGVGAFARFVNEIRNGGGGFAKFRAEAKADATALASVVSTIAGVVGPIVKQIADGFKSLPGPVKIAIGAIAGFAILSEANPIGAAIVGFAAVAILIKRNWSTIGPVVQSVRNAVSAWVNRAKPDLEVLRKAFNDVATVVKTVLTVAFNFALAVAKRAWPGIKAAVQGALQVIKGVVNVFLGILHGDWGRVWGGLKGIVSGAFKVMLGVIRAMTAPTREAVARVGKAALNFLSGLASKFVDIGKQLVQGLIDGVVSKVKDVADTVGGLAKGAVKIAKHALGIRSPSQEFRQIGEWVAQGLADGIAAGQGTVTAAIKAGLMFPLDAAIANLSAQKDKLQQAFDLSDATRQRAELVTAVGTARTQRSSATKGLASVKGGGSGGGLAWAQAMVGHFKETGFNTGPELDRLEKEFGMRAQAWCAMFATKALIKAGAPKGIATASVAAINSMAASGAHGMKFTGKPHAGNLMTFGSRHVAVVESVRGGVVRTIEGNTGAGSVSRGTHAISEGRFIDVPGVSGGGSLTSARGKVKSSKQAVADAVKALRDFDRERARTNLMAKIDLKIKGIEALKQFKDAVAGVRTQLHDLADQAGGVFRSRREAEIASGPEAAELAGLRAKDAQVQDAKTTAQLGQDLATAIAAGDVKAQQDAQDAIDAYARQKREDELQASIDAQNAGLDVEVANYKASLDNQLQALADNLASGKTLYAQFAKDVGDLLSSVGLGYQGSPDEEAAIGSMPAGSGGKAAPMRMVNQFQRNARPTKKRAAGGPVTQGIPYLVGEVGPETFVPDQSGRIVPSSKTHPGDGAVVYVNGDLVVNNRRDAERMANRLAFRLRMG